MPHPVISIIMPIYNGAQYIKQSVESILSQEFEDFELLLVNDGSTDNTIEICELISREDKRIRVIDKPHGGLSHTRNWGMEEAKGIWLTFVDVDDFIDSNHLNPLNNAPICDVIITGCKILNGDKIKLCQISQNDKILSIKEDEQYLSTLYLNKDELYGFTWNKFFKTEIIRNNSLSFREDLSYREDELFFTEYCALIKQILLSANCSYNYRILNNSLSHSDFKKCNYDKLAEALTYLINTRNFKNDFKIELINRNLKYYIRAAKQEYCKPTFETQLEKVLSFLYKYRGEIKLTGIQRIVFILPNRFFQRLLFKFYFKIKS